MIRKLKNPSIVAVVSVSESLLRTARSLLAPAIRRKHTFNEILAMQGVPVDPVPADLAFCDTVTISLVSSPRKVHYRLIAPDCLEHLAASLNGH
jgi:hypothetical protein